MRGKTLGLALLGGLLLGGCDKPGEPAGSSPPPPPPPTATAAAKPVAPSGASDVAFEKPGAWGEGPARGGMRKATFVVPKAEGDPEDGEMSVVQAGGSVDQNVARWEGQFQGGAKATRSDKTVNGLKVTIVELKGTFSGSGMPGGPPGEPKPSWMMLGAIVETQPPTFFKLTGPEKTVLAARGDFDKLVDGLRPK